MDPPGAAPPTGGPDADRARQECICPDCPTYTDCARDARERAYCVAGRSPACVAEDLGCVCPAYPVTAELELVYLTFCIEGSEAGQRAGPPG
jgi:hypothetical protein